MAQAEVKAMNGSGVGIRATIGGCRVGVRSRLVGHAASKALFCVLWAAAQVLAVRPDLQAAGTDVESRTPLLELATELAARQPKWGESVDGPLCGVYAACTALQLAGIDASPGDYMTARYVADPEGSTPEEVAAIVSHAGGNARILTPLSALDIRSLREPLIANVRASAAGDTYDHWVTITWNGTDVTFYDQFRSVRMPLAEFLAIWSGLGIVVSHDAPSVMTTAWLWEALLVQGAILVAFALRAALRNPKIDRSIPRQLLVIVAATALLSAAGLGILADARHCGAGLQLALAPFREGSIRHGSLDTAIEQARQGTCILVDARIPPDFSSGSIGNAINIPVDASLWDIRDYLKDVDQSVPFAVFCQSAQCEYNEVIARDLAMLGFTNITVCDRGWREFSAPNRKQSSRRSATAAQRN